MSVSDLRAVALTPVSAEQRIPALRRQDRRAASASAADGGVERRRGPSGKLGNRRTDNWMPYSTAFVAQLLGQQLDEQKKA
jgi:hypothetical protein